MPGSHFGFSPDWPTVAFLDEYYNSGEDLRLLLKIYTAPVYLLMATKI